MEININYVDDFSFIIGYEFKIKDFDDEDEIEFLDDNFEKKS